MLPKDPVGNRDPYVFSRLEKPKKGHGYFSRVSDDARRPEEYFPDYQIRDPLVLGISV
jgi:hypothetical protein